MGARPVRVHVVRTATEDGGGGQVKEESGKRRASPSDADPKVVRPVEVPRNRARALPRAYMPLLSLLITIAAGYGLVADDAYRLVSQLTRETWRAQDAVTLTTVPVLLWVTRLARAGSFRAHLVSVGILIWLTYSALTCRSARQSMRCS